MKTTWVSRAILTFVFSLFLMGPVYAGSSFPDVDDVRGSKAMNEQYVAYLQFVLAMGSTLDARQAKVLEDTFSKLKAKSPDDAAKFLKGLRYELVQKLSMMGAAPEQVSTRNTEMQRYVRATLPLWTREADEYLFRAATNSLAKR
jgi:hypothetical protein